MTKWNQEQSEKEAQKGSNLIGSLIDFPYKPNPPKRNDVSFMDMVDGLFKIIGYCLAVIFGLLILSLLWCFISWVWDVGFGNAMKDILFGGLMLVVFGIIIASLFGSK